MILKAMTLKKQMSLLPEDCVSSHHHSDESHDSDSESLDNCPDDVENPDEVEINDTSNVSVIQKESTILASKLEENPN